MKRKFLLLVIMFIFLFQISPAQASTYINFSGKIKDNQGSLIDYFDSRLILYIDNIEFRSTEINNGSFDTSVKNDGSQIGKELTFKANIYGKLVDAIPDEPVIITGQNEIVNLTIPDPLPIPTEIYVDQTEITAEIGDVFQVNLIAVYEDVYQDVYQENITTQVGWDSGKSSGGSNGGNQIIRINPGQYEAINLGTYPLNVDFYDFPIITIPVTVLDSPPIPEQNNTMFDTSFDTDTTLTINFQKNIAQDNNFGGIQLINLQGYAMGITKSIVNNVLEIKPLMVLDPNNNYVLYIPDGSVKTINGTSSTQEYKYTVDKKEKEDTIEILMYEKTQFTILDIVPLAQSYGSAKYKDNFNILHDLNNDNIIDLFDLVTLVKDLN